MKALKLDGKIFYASAPRRVYSGFYQYTCDAFRKTDEGTKQVRDAQLLDKLARMLKGE